ncbi:MAG: hypothetical protein IH984_17505 [Planctomycetes bacterium]|nr:hypothetical protein [Planctomycetota bacterium]
MSKSKHTKQESQPLPADNIKIQSQSRQAQIAIYFVVFLAGVFISVAAMSYLKSDSSTEIAQGTGSEDVQVTNIALIENADQRPVQQLDQPQSFRDLFALEDFQIDQCDIALLNLICAQGLPGSEELDVTQTIKTLDKWAEHVKAETAKHLYRFQQNPSEYNNSEAYFKTLMLIVVLQDDLNVKYNAENILEPDFTNSQDLFIHGMVGSENGGTCVSMPTLYVAVGQRLGYPMNLVVTKGHVFARWDDTDDGGERFNIEGTNRGLNTPTDEHYRNWPYKLTDAERSDNWFLKSLSPVEALTVFLLQRGHCLEDTKKLHDAQVAYALAHRLAPQSKQSLYFLAQAVAKEIPGIARTRAAGQRSRGNPNSQRAARSEWYESMKEHERSVIKPDVNPDSPLRSLGGNPPGSN